MSDRRPRLPARITEAAVPFMPTSPSWTVPLSGAPDAPLRLFIFPFAGGGSIAWRPWAPLLPAEWRTEIVLLPGREARLREPAISEMAALIPALVAGLRPHLDRPFAFYGHSMGAAVSFETARALEAAGQGPMHLFVSGRRAPGHPRARPPLHALGDAEFRAALERLGGTPKAVLDNEELMALFTPLLRSDFELSERYEPLAGARLASPVTAFGGSEDGEADHVAIEAWHGASDGKVATLMLPGGHFFIQPQAEAIIARMRSDLALERMSRGEAASRG